MLCHGGTQGLRIIINQKHTVQIHEAENIPVPQSAYAHHFNAVVPVDLSMLDPGTENTFSFEVDTAGHWWPQNLVYGMILRIYHLPSIIDVTGRITSPVDGEILGRVNWIIVETASPEEVSRIDLIGYYRYADLEGVGIYQQWHYGFHQGEIFNHIGTIRKTPFLFSWDIEWIPDQTENIQIMARIIRRDGYIHAVEAKMVFKSWSPGYFNGIYIIDFLVFFIKEGPKYDYFVHDVPIPDLHAFAPEKNILKTGKTPLYHGNMVDGVEIRWPGMAQVNRDRCIGYQQGWLSGHRLWKIFLSQSGGRYEG
jgi:hypothetical protein